MLQGVGGHRAGFTDRLVRPLPTTHQQQWTSPGLDLAPPHPKRPVDASGEQRGDPPGTKPGPQHHDEVRANSPDDPLVEPGVPDEAEEHQGDPPRCDHDEGHGGQRPSLAHDDHADAEHHCRDEPDTREQGQGIGQGESFLAEHDQPVEDEETRQPDGQQRREPGQEKQASQRGRKSEHRKHLHTEQYGGDDPGSVGDPTRFLPDASPRGPPHEEEDAQQHETAQDDSTHESTITASLGWKSPGSQCSGEDQGDLIPTIRYESVRGRRSCPERRPQDGCREAPSPMTAVRGSRHV